MSEEKPPERDSKGDVKLNYKPDWQQIRRNEHTYVFRYYDEEREHHFPHFELFSLSDKRIEKAKKDPDYFEKQLYWTPDKGPYDSFIKNHNAQLSLLVEFFKEVFDERAFIEGYQPSHKVFRVILPKSKHDEIINTVNDFELQKITDLIFEIIAIAQVKYAEEIFSWERPEMQKLVTSAEKETEKAMKVIEKLDDKSWLSGKKMPSKLLHINFAFNDETIKIEHRWLAEEFVDHFKKYYDDLSYKNWRLDLERYPDRFEDTLKKQEFKYRLAISFYNMLTKAGFFKVTKEEPTPNKLMLCIAKLLELCLIRVADEDELDEIKIKNVRNWLIRKELKPALTFADVPPNKERLLKYFEPELINFVGDTKRADAISVGLYLAKRFNLEHLGADLIHVAQALKESGGLIGHQMIGDRRPFEPTFQEFNSLSQFVNGVKAKKKITSIKYKLEGDDKEYELTQRLPLYLIEEAIKEYSDDNQVEFDTDPVKTTLTKFPDGSIKVDKAANFAQPEERFMVRFTKSFYDYLLAEAPPDERDIMPSERYYAIIANMLQRTWFFYHQRHPEWFVIAKVKQWHKLALSQ